MVQSIPTINIGLLRTSSINPAHFTQPQELVHVFTRQILSLPAGCCHCRLVSSNVVAWLGKSAQVSGLSCLYAPMSEQQINEPTTGSDLFDSVAQKSLNTMSIKITLIG